MENDLAWTDNGDGKLLQYDFAPPDQWTEERVTAELATVAALLEQPDSVTDASAPGWLRLARRLPKPLRAALIAELGAGNQLTAIGSSGWPNECSIVANMRERFTAARQAPPQGVTWRELNDPHYAREELSQKVDSTEFLIIT